MRRGLPTGTVVVGALVLCAPTVRAMDDSDIQRAVDKGVHYLRTGQFSDGTWSYPEIGATALAGLTLLECGAQPDDPTVQQAAAAVRRASPQLASTYSLSVSILFLDRLGDKADAPLIQALAARLLAGQTRESGWNYTCPLGADEEVRRLTTFARERNERVARKPPAGLPAPPVGGPVPGPGGAPAAPDGGLFKSPDDNSNTQFAILALWVARRSDVQVRQALARCEARFRVSQNPDHGWGYHADDRGASTATMTCAGLTGLAFGHGVASDAPGPGRKPRDVASDPAMKNALLALASVIGNPVGNKNPGDIPQLGQAGGRAYYFLWSLDRVAMAYGLDTLGKKDWYRWGCEILLSSQLPDGSWKGEFGLAGIDTSFALLFLRRSNLTQDLTARLRGRVPDPGKARLQGDFGGEGLKRRIRAGVEFKGAQLRAGSPEATRLSRALLRAAPRERERLLTEYKDTSGGAYTEALALAIPQLEGSDKAKAREALAQRLTRMTAATLRDKLKDDDSETRRAAALACGMKDDKQHIPDLIPLLEDSETAVASAAHRALKALTGQDFGRAPAAWKEWWQRKGAK